MGHRVVIHRTAVALMSVTMLAVGGCSSGSGSKPARSSTTVRPTPVGTSSLVVIGTQRLFGEISTTEDKPKVGAVCFGIQNDLGDGDFEDIEGGADVTVYDQNHEVIAAGTLDPGILRVATPVNSRECDFSFTITDVPDDKLFYTIAIGDHETGRLTPSQLALGPDLSIKSLTYSG